MKLLEDIENLIKDNNLIATAIAMLFTSFATVLILVVLIEALAELSSDIDDNKDDSVGL